MGYLHLRDQVFERDNWRCVYCWDDECVLHVEHIVPRHWELPNPHKLENLTTACPSCNNSKSARRLDQWLGVDISKALEELRSWDSEEMFQEGACWIYQETIRVHRKFGCDAEISWFKDARSSLKWSMWYAAAGIDEWFTWGINYDSKDEMIENMPYECLAQTGHFYILNEGS